MSNNKSSNKKNNSKKQYQYTPQSFPAQVPEYDQEEGYIPPSVKELDEQAEKQLLDFSALLDTLSSLEDRKKALWKQIYENAVTDRKNAYIMFGDLYKDVCNDPNKHALHGPNLSKYMERMEKANAQIIKLAEMIDDVAEAEEEELTDEESLYDRINNANENSGNNGNNGKSPD